MKQIAIIGAGIGGMAAAYDLVRAGHQVTILKPLARRVDWQPVSKNLIGTGRWKSSTIIGLPAMSICWVVGRARLGRSGDLSPSVYGHVLQG